MSGFEMQASLGLVTLVIAFLVVAIAFASFLRKRSNRHPLAGKQERNVAADLDAGRTAPSNENQKTG